MTIRSCTLGFRSPTCTYTLIHETQYYYHYSSRYGRVRLSVLARLLSRRPATLGPRQASACCVFHGRLPHAEASDLLLRPPLEAGTVQDNAFASESLQHSEPPSYRFLHRRGAAAFPAAQSGRKPRAISNCKCCCHCVYCCWSVMLRDPEMNLRGHGTIISAVPDNMWSHIAYEWLH
jgi:hypothetical protein